MTEINAKGWMRFAFPPYGLVVATGRSDFPNQVNNCLAFPGIFRGALDIRARRINDAMNIAAAHAIAGLVADKLSPGYILPEAMDFRVPLAHGLALPDRRRTAGGQETPIHCSGGAAKIGDWVKLP